MKLSQFIKALQAIEAEHGGDLPVCLADWAEDYSTPSEAVAERIRTSDDEHWENGSLDRVKGLHVLIG